MNAAMNERVEEGRLLELLKRHFGYEAFRPMQEDIIRQVIGGGDTLVLMPTGGGKSLCYQLPALAMPGLTVVVSPLIALMKDQVDALCANGVAAAFINSSLEGYEIAATMQRAREGELKLLYVAPERLAAGGFREFLDELTVSLIAIDEAHCISEWGHDFRPDYRNLAALRQALPQVPVVALTATATERVRRDIIAQLGLEQGRVFVSGFNRANLTYRVQAKQEVLESVATLLAKYPGESAIVYCFSRADCERLAAALQGRGVSALPYHAGLEGDLRQRHQEQFIRDEVQVMVATIAFGMGIDKPDIRLVVHADLPKTLEGYYQETGRAGRDGLPSECVLLYSYGDRMKQDFFIRQLEDEAEQVQARQKLAQVMEFCTRPTCRRKFLLEYFGETNVAERCESCDACLEPRPQFDATEIAQKILSAVVRTGERFGAAYVASVLVGKNEAKVRERGHDGLSVFGIVKDMSDRDVKELTASLVAEGLLAKQGEEYPTLALTGAGKQFLVSGAQLMLPKPLEAPSKRSGRSRAARARGAAGASGVESYDEALFMRLRVLRKRLADERGVPPFIIFGDAALQQMAAVRPQSLADFADISGVGAAKLEQLGEVFTREIQQYVQDQAAAA